MEVDEHAINVPKISKSKFKLKNALLINSFFDEWVLKWVMVGKNDLPYLKRLILKFFCTMGLASKFFVR